MSILTTGNIPHLLTSRLDMAFSNEAKSIPKQWEGLFGTETATGSTFDAQPTYGFGQVPESSEGAALTYDTPGEGYNSSSVIKLYKLGFKITREAFDDERYGQMKNMAGELAKSFIYTKNVNGANIFNNGFSDSYVYAYSEPLFGDATLFTHPLKKTGGTDYNRPETAGVDLNAASLKDAINAVRATLSDSGKLWQPGLRPSVLLVHPDNEEKAYQLVASIKTPENANNSENWIKTLSLQVVVNDFLTDPDAWFLLCGTNIHKLKLFQRIGLETDSEVDFNTDAMLYKGYERYRFGAIDWRGTWGSSGG